MAAHAVVSTAPSTVASRETLVSMLRFTKLQRAIEDRILLLYRQGKIVGGVYTGRGHEAIGAGSAILTGEGDVVFPSHRDLSAYLIRGMRPETIFAAYLGRIDGPTRGRDGNLHMGDMSLGIGSFISHMADTVPVAAGVALSFKLREQSRVVLCYNGDGATSRGDWHEGLNLAAVMKLPVIYICVNNRYAYSTPLEGQMAVASVAERAVGYGMPVQTVDGNEVLAVYRAAQAAVVRARAGKGPSFIEAVTYRITGHSAADNAAYVPPDFIEEGKSVDPIERYVAWLRKHELVTAEDLAAIDSEIGRQVDRAVETAEASPFPEGPDSLRGVYAD